MSTRCTLAYSRDFHLYQECWDNDSVYLELDGKGWNSTLEVVGDRKFVNLQIDVKLWRTIVEGWLASHWAKNPQQDYEKGEIDMDFVNRIFGKRVEESGGEAKDAVVDQTAPRERAPGISEL